MMRLLQVIAVALVMCGAMIACGGGTDNAKTPKGKDATNGGEAVAHGADDSGYADAEEEVVVLGCTSTSECGDEIACTRDECVAGDCEHIADNTLCKTGEVCVLTHGGCIAAKPCFENEDCKKEEEENCYLGDGEYGKCNTCVIRGCEKEPEEDKGFCTAEYYDGDCDTGEVCLGDLYESLPADMNDEYGNDFSEATGCYEGTRCAKNSECDDKVACTKDACLPQSVCRHMPQDASCDDGNPCTTDGCDPQNNADASGCVHDTDFAVCNDGISCTEDECAPDGACTHTPDDGFCYDYNECTADTCKNGCLHVPQKGPCESENGYKGTCMNGECCIPQCYGKECGDDACGGSCGECTDGVCVGDYWDNYVCCTPNCNGICGGAEDGCGGTCSECPDGQVCLTDQTCCTPMCEANGALICWGDGCGGTCSECPDGQVCTGKWCCTPQCDSKECGDDECYGSCGTCTANQVCLGDSICCTPNCKGKQCGDDGCDGTCGICNDGLFCTIDSCTPGGVCKYLLDESCNDGSECTIDGCDANGCTHIASDELCDDGITCTVDECSMNGCTHTPKGALCDDGDPCTKDKCYEVPCTGKEWVYDEWCENNYKEYKVCNDVDDCGWVPQGCAHTPISPCP